MRPPTSPDEREKALSRAGLGRISAGLTRVGAAAGRGGAVDIIARRDRP